MNDQPDFSSSATCATHKARLLDPADTGFRVLPPVWREFGGRTRFSAPRSRWSHEDNTVVKAALESPGEGRVLVVDGGGSLRRALVGGNIGAAAARKRSWAGMIIDSCVRDVAELAACDVGGHPRAGRAVLLPTDRRGEGQRDVPVQVGGVNGCVRGPGLRRCRRRRRHGAGVNEGAGP